MLVITVTINYTIVIPLLSLVQSVCLEDYSSPLELSSAGPERLKAALQALGLKCGGTLQERAQRLFATKGKTLEELDPSFFAKSGKQRRRRNK